MATATAVKPAPTKLSNDVLHDRSKDFCAQLMSVGIKAIPYMRPPLAPEVFAINLGSDVIRLWASTAEIQLALDAEFHQAVMTVTEPARTVSRSYTVNCREHDRNEQLRASAISLFPVAIPNRKVKSVVFGKRTRDHTRLYYGHSWHQHVTVTMSAPRSTQTFLVGMDERRQFICALPERAKTVKAAHRILRPKNVPADALRQGEFFFVRATNAEVSAIERHGRRSPHGAVLERGSTHTASDAVQIGGQLYAQGTVRDNRAVRHAPVQLEGWHRVVRNREVVLPETVSQRTRTWD